MLPDEYVDENVLKKLSSFMCETSFQELFAIFQIEFQESILLAKVNETKRGDVFHKLKGSSYTLGMNKLGNECYFCEQNYSFWNENECLKYIEQLNDTFILTFTYLNLLTFIKSNS